LNKKQKEERRMDKTPGGGKVDHDVYIGLVLIAFGIAGIVNAQAFPPAAKRFPMLACGLMIVLSLILVIRGLRRGAAIRKGGGTIARLFPWDTAKYALITFLMTGIYIALVEHVDFFVATVIFVPAMMIFMRVKKKWVIVLSTAGITFFCWFMFVNQLHIRMP